MRAIGFGCVVLLCARALRRRTQWPIATKAAIHSCGCAPARRLFLVRAMMRTRRRARTGIAAMLGWMPVPPHKRYLTLMRQFAFAPMRLADTQVGAEHGSPHRISMVSLPI